LRVVVVAPLKEGARERAREVVRSGPPFDPEEASFEQQHVFLTDREVVFTFEADPGSIDALAAQAALWVAAEEWKDLLADVPQVAESVYAWIRPADDGLSFAPTPGPGDSEGGDIYAPRPSRSPQAR
jgi:hypothetical protein